MRATIALFAVYALLGLASSESYEGYKVYKVLATNDWENDYLNSLEDSPDFDFWSKINKVGDPVSVMVTPRAQEVFENYLRGSGINYTVEIEDVESTIEVERQYHRKRPALNGRVTFDQYIRHPEINQYLATLAREYPDIVTIENIGQSYEGRDMEVIRISTGSSNPPKPVIFVEAGIHAREWISPAVALYVINQLVENPDNRYLIENVDWIVLPVTNPDGYEFTWDSTRLWRKTTTPGVSCNGVDGNRNWDFYWMLIGASNWECSETYAGPAAFSEIETQNLRDYVLKTPNIQLYISVHSYGQYLLYPWGWTSGLPDNWRTLEDLGQSVNTAISSVSGTSYRVGSSTNVLYAAAGNSVDWAMGVVGADIAYTIELPGGGWYGFDLPPARITPVAIETFEGFRVFGNYAASLRKYN